MQLPDFEKTLIPWIGKTAKMMGTYFAEKLRQHELDLTKEQMALLKKLHEGDGQMQNDLALITERDKASLARLVSTMEKKNLVARIPDAQDKRVNRIYLTRDGRRVFATALPIVGEIIDELQQGVSEQEIAAAIETLRKVQRNISI